MSTQGFLQHFFQNHQEWFLTLLSSFMCICGCLVIFSDLFIKLFNKQSSFDIKTNQSFVICGFSISAGSLVFTSLYNLLPKSLDYFKQEKSTTSTTPNLEILVFYFSGVIVCLALSKIIHKFTSESIVHCNHGGEGEGNETDIDTDSHSHSHSHSFLHTHMVSDTDIEPSGISPHVSHLHSHPNLGLNPHSRARPSSANSLEEEPKSCANGSHPSCNNSNSISNGCQSRCQSHGSSAKVLDEEAQLGLGSETALLLSCQIDKKRDSFEKKPILDFLDKFTKKKHQCIGIKDENCTGYSCTSEGLTQRVSYDINNLDFYRDHNPSSSLVAYTSSEQIPLIHVTRNSIIDSHPANFILSDEPNLKLHSAHLDDHHHKINTPVSKLLSIGLQTCLALTLHKFPEGFIMYATSKVDSKLGISIFLSLAIHNIIEGFSMTLPLYLALDSRIKAVVIAGGLGGLSQPIGALFGYYILKNRSLENGDSDFVFGILMAVTSGFLTVISLQLFSSAINFGGSANKVVNWCLVGMFIIMFSSALTDFA